MKRGLDARAQAGERVDGAVDLVAHAADLEHGVALSDFEYGAAQVGYHARSIPQVAKRRISGIVCP